MDAVFKAVAEKGDVRTGPARQGSGLPITSVHRLDENVAVPRGAMHESLHGAIRRISSCPSRRLDYKNIIPAPVEPLFRKRMLPMTPSRMLAGAVVLAIVAGLLVSTGLTQAPKSADGKAPAKPAE